MREIATARCAIRELTPADRPAVERVLGPGREDWLEWTVRSYTRLAELHQPPYGERALTLRATGEVIGLVGFVPSLGPFGQLLRWTPAGEGMRPEVGLFYSIDLTYRGQGYATEAARALIDYGFDHLHLARIVATTDYDNNASIGVMRNAGMHISRNPLPTPHWFQVVGSIERSARC
jgi:[ribosomal protein S5]-alanine N-acetyltransferase